MKIHTLLLALVAVMAIAFAACGDDDDDRPSETATATATTAATETASAAVTPTPSPPATFFDCGTHASTPPDSSAFPITVTDTADNTVTLDAPPAKIASLDAAHTEILFAIGAGDQVTAVDNTSDCPTTVASLPQVDAFTPSLEAITALEPDLVVLFYDAGDIVAALRSAGLDVLLLETPPTVEKAYADIDLLGKATGHADEAEALVLSMIHEVEDTKRTIEGETSPSVFHELDSTYFTVGDGSYIDDLYTILGADNIGHGLGLPGPQLSSEAIIDANPDVIILADTEFGESPETVAARPGWSNIDAVKNHRVVGIDADIVSRPGPRIVDALRLLKFALYP